MFDEMPKKHKGNAVKRPKKKDKSRKTHDKYGKYTQKYIRKMERLSEKKVNASIPEKTLTRDV